MHWEFFKYKKCQRGLLASLLLVVCLWGLPVDQLMITTSNSLEKRVYFLLPPKDLTVGDFVLFSLENTPYEAMIPTKNNSTETLHLTKKIACMAPSQVQYKAGHYYCDGFLMTHDFLNPTKGAVGTTHQLQPGEYFVLGDHPRSLDSRIFKTISRQQIRSKAVGLW